MTDKELKTLESELQKRGYRKWTTALTPTETYAWSDDPIECEIIIKRKKNE